MKATIRFKGGVGSGHLGHRGVPGKRGGSLPGSGYTATTAVKAPAKKKRSSKRMTIQQAEKLLAQNGYKLGQPRMDSRTWKPVYQVTFPDNSVKELSVEDIMELL